MVRRPPRAEFTFEEWLANLHDAFLTAQLMCVLMDAQPVVTDPAKFMVSDRGRLERCLMRDLYVLIEGYRCEPGQGHADELARLAPGPHTEVERLLAEAHRVDALRKVRDYMSHRDLRAYMDEGRTAVAQVGLSWCRSLEAAFAEMLLVAMRQ